MKALFISCFVSVFLLNSCEKDNFIQSSSLAGKWKLVGSYYSIGGPSIYTEAKNKSYIFFNKEGGVQFDGAGFTSYKLKDSVTITLVNPDQTEFDYFYKITDGQLSLSPRTVVCIEGCSSIYRKVEE